MSESIPHTRRWLPLRYVLIPVVALTGIGLVVYTVIKQVPRVPTAAISVAPPKSPFDTRISGIGTVLPSSNVVSVGTAIAGVVEEVAVTEGQLVKMGDLLFRVDGRQTRADIAVASARLAVARAKLAGVAALPRATTLREAQAMAQSAQAQLVDAQGRLDRLEELGANAATSRNERPKLEFELTAAHAAFDRAQAQLDEVKQGAWAEDIAVAKAEVEVAQAEVARLETQMQRESVRASIDGTVLYVDIDPGEHVVPGSMQQMVALGDLDPLHVRVQIDEMDAWRFRPQAKAVAMPRGGAAGEYQLKYLRMIPLIVPKHVLSGDSTERVDVRVMEVEYELSNPSNIALLPGQIVDVFVEASAESGAAASDAAAQTQPAKSN